MAANRLPASLMNALDPAAGARRSRWTAARAGAPRCPCISRCSRPASGQTLIVPSSFGRGELPRRLRAPFARNVIPGAHAADLARSRCSSEPSVCTTRHRSAAATQRRLASLQARGAGADRRAHCAVSGPAPGADLHGIHVSAWGDPGGTIRKSPSKPEGHALNVSLRSSS